MENKEIKKTRTINIITIIAIIATLLWLISKFIHIGVEYTDNAQVRGHITPINSRVQGYIKDIRFQEFCPVKKGDTLVVIEDIEYRLRVAQAEADLQKALQNREAAATTATTARNNVSVSEASLGEIKVQLDNSRREYERYEKLLACGAVTRQQYENVKTSYEASAAKYNTMQKQRKSTSLVSEDCRYALNSRTRLLNLPKPHLSLQE